ncbi:DUF362 domain-containing protein [Ruminiclostridium papyrosolvens]|uniref:4Fe-4S ferredoxin-type domain-containing protein n=1 Tax=Ruminiclostridium papyrosolvens C7 TaxID=1330534 RepID=U4R012_9FIRM|nr:DUF362 domain-containing protein [Ruminiclostridium papyrosolvens]EPR10574.1 hypothetical protein L323_13730 [Ruminiclostridium papyrosolvens C7]
MNKISLKLTKTYDENEILKALRESFEFIGGLDSIVKSGDTVLLKLNLTGPFRPEQAATTHPVLVKMMVRLIKECGGHPIIGDGPATIKSPIKDTGIEDVAQEEKVPAFVFEKFQQVHLSDYSIVRDISYSTDVLQADKVISMPKLKTHALTLYTGAIKNMFGAVAFEQRKALHKYKTQEEFSKLLTDIFSVRVPDLTVMDGIWGMDGIGPVHGNPVNFGVLLVSRDAVAIDALSATLLGYKIDDVQMIGRASERNLGESNLDNMFIDDSCYKERILHTANLIPTLQGGLRERFLKLVLGKIQCDSSKCSKCSACLDGCPANAITMNPYPVVDENACLHCFRCYEICFHGALSIKYKKINS